MYRWVRGWCLASFHAIRKSWGDAIWDVPRKPSISRCDDLRWDVHWICCVFILSGRNKRTVKPSAYGYRRRYDHWIFCVLFWVVVASTPWNPHLTNYERCSIMCWVREVGLGIGCVRHETLGEVPRVRESVMLSFLFFRDQDAHFSPVFSIQSIGAKDSKRKRTNDKISDFELLKSRVKCWIFHLVIKSWKLRAALHLESFARGPMLRSIFART